MFRTVPLPIIKSSSLYIQQWCMSHRFADSLRARSGRNCSSVLIVLCDIYHCCDYSEKLLMMDRGTVRNMQSFIPKSKFEKLVHLIGFILRITSAVLMTAINLEVITLHFPNTKTLYWFPIVINFNNKVTSQPNDGSHQKGVSYCRLQN